AESLDPTDEHVEADEALALSCQDAADRDPELGDATIPARLASRLRFKPLRSRRLFSLLRKLGCEVSQGKGSEATVYREGGKKCTLGHHGQCVEVRWLDVKRLLKQVGIGLNEWFEVVYD